MGRTQTWKQLNKRSRMLRNVVLFAGLFLSVVIAALAAVFALAIEFFIGGESRNLWWWFAGVAVLGLAVWVWRTRALSLGTVIDLDVDQVEARGTKREDWALEQVDTYAPIRRPYVVSPKLRANGSPIDISENVRSAANAVQHVVLENHRSILKVVPTGHFPALFALGALSVVSMDTRIVEPEKKTSRGMLPQLEFSLRDLIDEGSIEPSNVEVRDRNVRVVELAIGVTGEPMVSEWAPFESFPRRRRATVRIAAGHMRDNEVLQYRRLRGAESDGVRPFSPVRLSPSVEDTRHGGNRSVVDAGRFVAFVIARALWEYPNAEIRVICRAPRAVVFGAGALIGALPSVRWEGVTTEVAGDYASRLRLWGPVYGPAHGADGTFKRYEFRDNRPFTVFGRK